MNEKHAYLIMAHNNFEQLQLLIKLLDDPRNDIYLHIDRKAKAAAPKIETRYSQLTVIDPICVTWGGHSQIECEMNLFKAAASGHYMYYHLISGLDLPLKTQNEIHAFFQSHKGKNFIKFDKNANEAGSFRARTQYFHFFQNIAGRSNCIWAQNLRKVKNLLVYAQKLFHIERKEFFPLWKGANWVSITDDMVQYIISCDKLIKKQFYYSVCADEIFLQSVAMYSPYRDTIVNNYYREIDWNRGNPYTFRKEDISELLKSSAVFARKFDESVDKEAIYCLVDYINEKSCRESESMNAIDKNNG